MSEATSKPIEATPTIRARRQLARLVAAWALAAVTALCASLGLWSFLAPDGPAGSILPLSPPHVRFADVKLDPSRGPVDLDGAERETRRALAHSPGLAIAWVRLAYIETWRHGRLTPAALEHLRKSYEVAPLGPDASAARITLIFESWPDAPPEIRSRALREVVAVRARNREEAHKWVEAIRNPEGRLAIGMAIAAAESEDALKRLD